MDRQVEVAFVAQGEVIVIGWGLVDVVVAAIG